MRLKIIITKNGIIEITSGEESTTTTTTASTTLSTNSTSSDNSTIATDADNSTLGNYLSLFFLEIRNDYQSRFKNMEKVTL